MKKKDKKKLMLEMMARTEDMYRMERRFKEAVLRDGEGSSGMFIPFKRKGEAEEVALVWIRAVFPKSLEGELFDVLCEGVMRIENEISEALNWRFELG